MFNVEALIHELLRLLYPENLQTLI